MKHINKIRNVTQFFLDFPTFGGKVGKKVGKKWEKVGKSGKKWEKVGKMWEKWENFFFSLGALSQGNHGPAPNGVRAHVPAKK